MHLLGQHSSIETETAVLSVDSDLAWTYVRPDRLIQIADGLHRLRIPDGDAHLLNSYIWVGPEGVTLFDTGWASSASIIEAALPRLDRKKHDVERLVLSHFHEDHAGAAAEIAAWSDAEIVACAIEAPVLRGLEDGPLPRFTAAEKSIHTEPTSPPKASACRVDTQVVDGEILPFAGGAHVLQRARPHARQHRTAFSRSRRRIDWRYRSRVQRSAILGVFNVDRDQTRESARKIAATGASVAGFGHGEPVLSNASRLIENIEDPFAD